MQFTKYLFCNFYPLKTPKEYASFQLAQALVSRLDISNGPVSDCERVARKQAVVVVGQVPQ